MIHTESQTPRGVPLPLAAALNLFSLLNYSAIKMHVDADKGGGRGGLVREDELLWFVTNIILLDRKRNAHHSCVGFSRSRNSYLFVTQRCGGFEGRRRTQAAEGPRLADLWWFQWAAIHSAEAAQVGQVGGGADHAQRFAFHRLQEEGNRTIGRMKSH